MARPVSLPSANQFSPPSVPRGTTLRRVSSSSLQDKSAQAAGKVTPTHRRLISSPTMTSSLANPHCQWTISDSNPGPIWILYKWDPVEQTRRHHLNRSHRLCCRAAWKSSFKSLWAHLHARHFFLSYRGRTTFLRQLFDKWIPIPIEAGPEEILFKIVTL